MADFDQLDEGELARVERDALFAAILATLCHLAAVMVCCVAPAGVVGIGTGLGSLYLSKKVLDTGVDGTARGYAYVASAMSFIGILWSGFVLLCVCAYLTFYVAMIMAMGAGGNF